MDLLGSDAWDCDGYSLTPVMRQEILAALAAEYEDWCRSGMSWEWAVHESAFGDGRIVRGLKNNVRSVADFLNKNTGETHWFYRELPLSYWKWFEEWLKEYLFENWGPEVYEVHNEDHDPLLRAEDRVFQWVETLRLTDIVAWYLEQNAKENSATATAL